MDIDGDGNKDILSGSYSRTKVKPMAGLFHVLHGDGKGGFGEPKVLNGTDGEPLIIPLPEPRDIAVVVCTRPTAVDWDGDGDLDIVTGNFTGTFYLFEGEGEGKFSPVPTQVKNNAGEPLQLPSDHHSDPVFADWDGDGDLDLLSGSNSGKIFWSKNESGKGKVPSFGTFSILIEDDPTNKVEGASDRRATRICVDDLNKDGRLDVLVGDKFYATDGGNRVGTGTVWMYLQK